MKNIKTKNQSKYKLLLFVITAWLLGIIGACTKSEKKSDGPVAERPSNKLYEKKILKVTSGKNHSCALIEDDVVKCWGRLLVDSNGTTVEINSNIPRTVVGFDGPIKDLVSGEEHNCVILKTGPIQCWGRNASGQLGDGTELDSSKPVFVKNLKFGVVKVVAGKAHTCAFFVNDSVACWGSNLFYQSEPIPQNHTNNTPENIIAKPSFVLLSDIKVRDLVAGANHTCVLSTAGAVACWGANQEGQAGQLDVKSDQDLILKNFKIVPKLEQGVKQLVAGPNHSCALLIDGKVYCWGSNSDGQIGSGAVGASRYSFTLDELSGKIDSIIAGPSRSCVLQQGVLTCWGSVILFGTYWERNFHPSPMKMFGLQVTDVSIGSEHICTLSADQKVRCWGINTNGQLGDGTFDNHGDAPVEVQNLL